MKKFFLSFVLLFSALTGLAQSPTNVQKGGTAGTNNITGDLNIGTGKTWTVASGGTLTIASGATVNTPAGAIPWSAISNTPTSIAGYGILDPLVYTNVSYSNPAWITALAASKITGVLVSSNMPAYTGDVTSSSGATVNTLATVNVSPGVIGSGTAIPVITVNGKGLTTLVTTATNTPAYANITGLPSTAAGYGITNGAAIDALGAVSSTGLLQRTAANTYSVATYSGLAWNAGVLSVTADAGLPDQSGANAQFLTSNGSAASWSFVPLTTGVSGILPIANGGTGRATGTTAYGLLAAGTTAAGVQQTLPAGATTELLVGGGASALPAWTTATGSGAPVRATSPTLVTPTLGVATATSINGVGLSGSGSVANTGVTALTAFTGSGTSSGTNTGDQTTISGNAATATALQTARSIYGNNFDGTAALAQIIASTFGGTGNGFTKFSGPTTSEKTFTLPNASATILTDNAAVTVPQGGTGRATGTTAYGLIAAGTTATGAQQTLAAGATTEILVGGGASALPVWTTASGSGAPVRATSPVLVTPTLGAALATSINGNFFTTGSSTYTGTAAQTYTFPTTTAIIARTDAAQTFTGLQTFGSLAATDTGSSSTMFQLSRNLNGTLVTSIALNNAGTTGSGVGNYIDFQVGGNSQATIGGWFNGTGILSFYLGNSKTEYGRLTSSAFTLGVPVIFSGTSSITSALLTPLTLGTGTSGTALSIASATNAITIGGTLNANSTILNGGDIYHSTDNGAWALSGGTPSQNGGNIVLFGGTHASLPNTIKFQIGSSSRFILNSTTATWGSELATLFQNTAVSTSSSTGAVVVTGGLGVGDKIFSAGNINTAGDFVLTTGHKVGILSSSTDYGLYVSTTQTWLNVKSGGTIQFGIADSSIASFSTTGVLSLASTTEATTTANSGSFTTAGGANITKTAIAKHFGGQGTAPTGAVGVGAGTSPSAVTFDATANDVGGIVSVTTGTLPTAASVVLTVTFNGAYATAPHVTITPANAATALLTGVTMVYASTTTGTFVINAGSTGIVAATGYSWFYQVAQ